MIHRDLPGNVNKPEQMDQVDSDSFAEPEADGAANGSGHGSDVQDPADGILNDVVDEEAAEDFQNEEYPAQPDGPNGVTTGMASLALNPSYSEPQGFRRGQDSDVALSQQADPMGQTPMGQTADAAAASALSDAEIMLRVRDGDDSGFDFLIAKYRRPIIHFMYRIVHNEGVAEELAQEVFLRVYRSRATYRAEARFSTWLYRIATNLGVNHARDTRHERTASNVYLDVPDAETGTTPDLADDTPTVEQDMLKQERLKAIRQHVLALPERQRSAVLMHKYEGMDYKQIGEVLKLSESATKSLLFRAYQSLREKLKDFV